MWDAMDASIFHFLNGTLALGRGWSGIWAVGNTRYFDLVAATIMAVFILRKNIVFKKIEIRHAVYSVASLLLILLVIRGGFTSMVDSLGWQRSSPSLVTDNAIRLSKEFPTLKSMVKMKDASSRSFPGDHASVLLVWTIFMVMFAQRNKIWLPISVAVLLMLPRLVAGAHWFTDIAVGASLLALVSIAWGYCTPVVGWLYIRLDKLSHPIIERLRGFRVLRRLSVLQEKD